MIDTAHDRRLCAWQRKMNRAWWWESQKLKLNEITSKVGKIDLEDQCITASASWGDCRNQVGLPWSKLHLEPQAALSEASLMPRPHLPCEPVSRKTYNCPDWKWPISELTLSSMFNAEHQNGFQNYLRDTFAKIQKIDKEVKTTYIKEWYCGNFIRLTYIQSIQTA